MCSRSPHSSARRHRAAHRLASLDLSHNPIVSVAELGALTKLRWLDLKSTDISTLRGLEGLAELEDLDLSRSRVFAISELAGLPLRSLDLGNCVVPQLDAIATMVRLESLTLGHPQLPHLLHCYSNSESGPLDLDLGPVERCSSLRQLYLCGLWLPSATVFDELVKLEELTLDDCVVSDGFREFPELLRLEQLNVFACEVSDLRAIASLPRLRVLQFSWVELSDLTPLLACPSLEKLILSGGEIEDRGSIEQLRQHPRLSELRIDHQLIAL